MQIVVEVDQTSFSNVMEKLKLRGNDEGFRNVIETSVITEFVNNIKRKVLSLGIMDKGLLYRSINHKVVSVKNDEIEIQIGDGTSYGLYHEKGTGIYAEGGGGRQTPWWYFIPGIRRGWVKELAGTKKHFGTKETTKSGNMISGTFIKTVGVHPRPFMVPTIIEQFNSYLQRIGEGIIKLLKEK